MSSLMDSLTQTTPDIRTLIEQLLISVGENPSREGLEKTPERVEKAFQFMTKGYQEEQLEERQYRISYVAEQATRWDWLDDYLKRRCQELAGSHVALMSDITHDTHTVTAMSSVAVGAPVIAGGNDFGGVMMPVTSAPHEVVFNLKKAEGRCSF